MLRCVWIFLIIFNQFDSITLEYILNIWISTGFVKPCTQLYPAPSTSIQIISASTQLSATLSILLEPKYCTKLGNFPKFRPKIHLCLFWLKIGTHGISRMLILIPTLVFWISNPKSIFGQILVKKFKVAHFARKLACMVSRGYWFLFRH